MSILSGSKRKRRMARLIIFLLLISNLPLLAQPFSLDSLEVIGNRMLNHQDESIRLASEKKVEHWIDSLLASPDSWEMPFEGVRSIAILKSPDDRFRIFNWNIPYQDGTYLFYGRIQLKAGKKTPYTVIPLYDASGEITKASSKSLSNDQWFGALYYKVIKTTHKKKTYYTLLGWDGNTAFSNKKLIDVIQLDASGKVSFGAPIFDDGKRARYRVFFEHSERVTMSLRYQESKNWIVFDHLAPSQASLVGQYEFYGPDFTFDAFVWEKGKWKFKQDVDVRNEGKNEGKQTKKPQQGLQPVDEK